tara:strand:+ start:100 stop:729 length:630 start_codon:yes stop_codon:yes gene_type:complete
MEIKKIHEVGLCGLPIRVYETDFILSNSKIEKIKEEAKQGTRFKERGAHLTKNKNILKYDYLADLAKVIDTVAVIYRDDTLGISNKIKMTHSWGAYQQEGQEHHGHRHQNVLFSVVYYAKVKSGNLRFSVDKSILEEQFYFDYTITNYNEYNSTSWTIPQQAGNIAVFPGSIMHGTTPNIGGGERIAVGANYFVTGMLGNEAYTQHEII